MMYKNGKDLDAVDFEFDPKSFEPRKRNVEVTIDEMVVMLRKANYDVASEGDDCYKITGHGIYGFLGKREDEGPVKLYIDHKGCFNKATQCPLQVPLPRNERQINWLFERLTFWGTKSAYKISNEYQFELYDKEYPMR
jgi:hypothetical protein